MKPASRYLVAALLPLYGTPLFAAEVIEGVTATATSQWSASQSAANLVNNSGLRTAGSTPINQTPTAYDITAVHTYDQSAFGQWHNTGPSDPNSVITFDLGGSFNMDAIHIWNGNQWSPTLNLTARGTQQFDVLVSTDGTNFTEVVSDQTLTRSPGNVFVPAQSFSLAGNSGITHVRLRIDSNHGDAYTGLSEVMFTHVVDPGLSAPAARNFGSISVAQTKQETITLTNGGPTQALTLSSVTLEGPHADFFTLDSFPSSIAANGGTGDIQVTFDPDGYPGDFFATLVIVSDKGGVPDTVTEIELTAKALPDPQVLVAPSFTFPRTRPSATRQSVIAVGNIGLTQALTISQVAVVGADADHFTVAGYPSSIGSGATGDIAIVFDPDGQDRTFSAVLEITCNDGGVADSTVTVQLTAVTDLLAHLSQPTITASAPGFNATFGADKLFDSSGAEFATAGGGAGTPLSTTNGTWVELDFGSPVKMDRMILVTRGNNADVIGESRLILSLDPVFDETDTIHVFSSAGSNGQAPIHSFPATTARYARWEVLTSLGAGQNLGGMEMRFLDTPSGSYVAPVTVIGGATAFSAAYALDNAADGDAGRGLGIEYASQSLGAAMFVDFDLGSSKPIIGFDLFDRIPVVDRTTAFDLHFSDDPTFTTGVTTLSFAPGSTGWGYRQAFAPVTARYLRIDATASTIANGNTGMQEVLFYTSAAPATGTAYEEFITTTWGLSGADAAADFDYDGDGLVNAIEFVLGSDPTTSSTAVMPTAQVDETMISFTFRRTQASASDSPYVEYGSDLSGWTTAVHGTAGVTITTTPDGFGAGVDSVTVGIPRALAVDSRLFTRLVVDVATTP